MTKRTKEEVYKDLEGIFEIKKLEDYCEQIANDLEEEGEKFLTLFQALVCQSESPKSFNFVSLSIKFLFKSSKSTN